MGKGPDFERELCKTLSIWWTNGKRDDIFWRTSQSGGRATSRRKVGKDTRGQHGDIGSTDPIGEPLIDLITFELKRGYPHSTFQDLVDRTDVNGIGRYEGWLRKAHDDHTAAGSLAWILVQRRDRRQPFLTMPLYLWTELSQYDRDIPCPTLRLLTECRSKRKTDVVLLRFDVVGMPLERFLRIDPLTFLELAKDS